MTPIREHAANLISAQADEGLKNLRAQLALTQKVGDPHKIAYFERRIDERKRLLERILRSPRGQAGIENAAAWRERRSLLLLMCEREGHDWVNSTQRGRYCRRCRLAKEFA